MSGHPYSYTVKSGDSLVRIGSRFGVPWRELWEHNRLQIGDNPSRIYPGLELLIPGRVAVPVVERGGGVAFIMVDSDDDDTPFAWPRGLHTPRFVVVHDPVARGVDGLLRYLRTNPKRVGYDYVIGPDALPKVYRLSDADEWVGHAGHGTATDALTGRRYGHAVGGNLNHVSFGVCLYKEVDDTGPFPEAMERAAVALVGELCGRHGIDWANVVGHGEVDPGRRTDPRGLDMSLFRTQIRGIL